MTNPHTCSFKGIIINSFVKLTEKYYIEKFEV